MRNIYLFLLLVTLLFVDTVRADPAVACKKMSFDWPLVGSKFEIRAPIVPQVVFFDGIHATLNTTGRIDQRPYDADIIYSITSCCATSFLDKSCTPVKCGDSYKELSMHVYPVRGVKTMQDVRDHIRLHLGLEPYGKWAEKDWLTMQSFHWGTLYKLNSAELGYAPGNLTYYVIPNKGLPVVIDGTQWFKFCWEGE